MYIYIYIYIHIVLHLSETRIPNSFLVRKCQIAWPRLPPTRPWSMTCDYSYMCIYIYIYMCILASLLLVLYAYIMVSVKKHSFWTSLCPATQQQKPLSSPWFGVFQVNISACIILWRSVFVHRHRYHLSFGAVFLFNRKLSAEVAINVSYVMDCETTSVVYYLAGNAKTRLLVPGCTTPLTKRNNCQNSGGLLQST